MTDTKQTPSPWRVLVGYHANGNYAVVGDGVLICEDIASKADAELIAAAPNMLKALRLGLRQVFNAVAAAGGNPDEHRGCREMAEAIIKAESGDA